jgi:signal transduction histidine kinase
MAALRVDELIWQTKDDLLKHHAEFIINIDLDENLDDEFKLTIRGDDQLLKAAFTNIIENGCKYSNDRTTNVFIQSSDGAVVLRFRDNGIGIPPADLPNIFEPFYRGTNTKNIKGHGIGLSMVKGIIRLHKGTIHLHSAAGSGTTVMVSLPTIS